MRRRGRLRPLWLVAVAITLGACGLGAIPIPNATPTPCSRNCPPPAHSADVAHTAQTRYFTVVYYDPWSVQSSDSGSVQLAASTQFGDITIIVRGTTVGSGMTAQRLLSQTAQQVLDPNQYFGIQESGPINGAEIGYVPGAGEAYQGYSAQPNTPNVPVFIQIMSCVRGTAGVSFVAVSPLDPNSPDPSLVPDQDYDEIVNGVQWH
ncbi:MAG: hypothetical protein ACXVDA_09525 [Ktedonobacterales bacterium]